MRGTISGNRDVHAAAGNEDGGTELKYRGKIPGRKKQTNGAIFPVFPSTARKAYAARPDTSRPRSPHHPGARTGRHGKRQSAEWLPGDLHRTKPDP